jgi:hypothetical protein
MLASVAVGAVRTGQIKVQGATLDSVLHKANAPTPIDYVSIDVEGHEIAVLEGFDLKHWRPRLLVVEDLAMNVVLHRYLKGRGYSWFCRAGLNAWFAPSDTVPAISPFGRWQFFRKHYLSLPFRHAREIKRDVVLQFLLEKELLVTLGVVVERAEQRVDVALGVGDAGQDDVGIAAAHDDSAAPVARPPLRVAGADRRNLRPGDALVPEPVDPAHEPDARQADMDHPFTLRPIQNAARFTVLPASGERR